MFHMKSILKKKIEKSKKAHHAKIVVKSFECHMC